MSVAISLSQEELSPPLPTDLTLEEVLRMYPDPQRRASASAFEIFENYEPITLKMLRLKESFRTKYKKRTAPQEASSSKKKPVKTILKDKGSRGKKLIRVRDDIIYFDFSYRCKETKRLKRHRSSAKLRNTSENQKEAKRLAILKRQELEGLPPRKEEKPSKAKQPSLKEYKSYQDQKGSITLNDFTRYYKTRKKYTRLEERSKTLYQGYLRNHLLPFFGTTKLKDIDEDSLEDFEVVLEAIPLSPKSIKDVIGFLKGLLNFALERRFIASVPKYTVYTKRNGKKKPKALTKRERGVFLEYVQQQEAFYYPAILFTMYTGVRMGEMKALTWRDLSLDSEIPYVHIHQTLDPRGCFKGTKTNQDRKIPLKTEVVKELQRLQEEQGKPKDNDFVFLSKKRTTLSKTTLHKLIKRVCERAGVKEISFHGLRHTFATIVTNEHGVAKASRLLGHSDIKTTMLYYQEDLSELYGVVEGI